MTRPARGLAAVLLVGAVLLPGVSFAGWVILSQSSTPGGKTFRDTEYFQRDKVRTESEGTAHVLDFARRRILWVDTNAKKYSVTTFDEFRRMMRESARKANEAMSEMKKAGIPLPGGDRPKGKVQVTGIAGATVAGYACDGYRVTVGGTETENLWLARKVEAIEEIGPAAWREFEDIAREMRQTGMSLDESLEDPAYKALYAKGYPMKSVDRQSGLVHEVTHVEKKALDAALFEEPKGYRKEPFEAMLGGGVDEPRGAVRPEGLPSDVSGGDAIGKAAGAGKQEAEEAAGAAKDGATQPVEEKKGEVLDTIRDRTKEGIKKLFKW